MGLHKRTFGGRCDIFNKWQIMVQLQERSRAVGRRSVSPGRPGDSEEGQLVSIVKGTEVLKNFCDGRSPDSTDLDSYPYNILNLLAYKPLLLNMPVRCAVMELLEGGGRNRPFRRLILKLPYAQMPVIEIMTNYVYLIKNKPVTSTLLVYARNSSVNYNDNIFLTKQNVVSYNVGKIGKNLVYAARGAANKVRGAASVNDHCKESSGRGARRAMMDRDHRELGRGCTIYRKKRGLSKNPGGSKRFDLDREQSGSTGCLARWQGREYSELLRRSPPGASQEESPGGGKAREGSVRHSGSRPGYTREHSMRKVASEDGRVNFVSVGSVDIITYMYILVPVNLRAAFYDSESLGLRLDRPLVHKIQVRGGF